MLDLESAKKQLTESGYTCVLCKGDAVFRSRIRGVAPLLEFLDSERSFCGFSAADKVVGKGAALLYVLLGVSAVHAMVISAAAYAVLREAGVRVTYGEMVPYIKNRAGNGRCPIEAAVSGTSDAIDALPIIRDTYLALQQNK